MEAIFASSIFSRIINSPKRFSGAAPIDNWILASGTWNDAGIWNDTSIWN